MKLKNLVVAIILGSWVITGLEVVARSIQFEVGTTWNADYLEKKLTELNLGNNKYTSQYYYTMDSMLYTIVKQFQYHYHLNTKILKSVAEQMKLDDTNQRSRNIKEIGTDILKIAESAYSMQSRIYDDYKRKEFFDSILAVLNKIERFKLTSSIESDKCLCNTALINLHSIVYYIPQSWYNDAAQESIQVNFNENVPKCSDIDNGLISKIRSLIDNPPRKFVRFKPTYSYSSPRYMAYKGKSKHEVLPEINGRPQLGPVNSDGGSAEQEARNQLRQKYLDIFNEMHECLRDSDNGYHCIINGVNSFDGLKESDGIYDEFSDYINSIKEIYKNQSSGEDKIKSIKNIIEYVMS